MYVSKVNHIIYYALKDSLILTFVVFTFKVKVLPWISNLHEQKYLLCYLLHVKE